MTKFHIRFNEERKFNELENINLSKGIDAKILSNKLEGLKWITYLYPDEPQKELNNLKKILGILKDDKLKKIIITEYQVISPILDVYDNSPNQWHHPSVSFPLKGNKYFQTYKNYFISNIKKKNIEVIYEVSEKKKIITELILEKDCFSKEKLNPMLVKIKLNYYCKDLK